MSLGPHNIQLNPLEGLETKVCHTDGQLWICGQFLIKTLNAKAWVIFSGWQYSAYFHTLCLGKINSLHTAPVGEDNLKFSVISGPCPMFLLPLLNLICILLL